MTPAADRHDAVVNPQSRIGSLRDAIRTSLWPLPTLAVLGAVVTGIGVPRLDAHVDSSLPGFVADLLFEGSPDAARTILQAIAGSMITVTSLTFSLTVVTLQLASSQFSPRLLRTFARDLFVQATLSLFLATFAYSLTVLRGIRTGSGDRSDVPSLGVSFGFLLALASVIGLVLFLAHLANEIRVESMLGTVHADATATVRAMLGEPGAEAGEHDSALPQPAGEVVALLAPASGFVTRLREAELVAGATRLGCFVVIDAAPGAAVVAGTPVGATWRDGGRVFTGEERGAIEELVGQVLHIGHERTSEMDIGYGIRQITDVAVKALSPGVNDPTTAVHALGHSAALLCDLSERELEALVLRDGNGAVVGRVQRPAFAELLDIALAQPRRYGAQEPAVLERMLTMLREIAWRSRPVHRPAIADQLERLRPYLSAPELDGSERGRLRACAEAVSAALAGEWAGSSGTVHREGVRPTG